MGITAADAVQSLEGWNAVMQDKTITLKKGAIFYRIMNYFCKVAVGILTVALLGLESSIVSGGISPIGVRAIAVSLIAIQCLSTFFTVSDAVVQPAAKSDGCLHAANQYDCLSREVVLKIQEYRNARPNQCADKYLFETLNYSTREQLILQMEPLLVYFGHNRKAAVMPMTPAQRSIDEEGARIDIAIKILSGEIPFDEISHLSEIV
jgi:hypothetical protein